MRYKRKKGLLKKLLLFGLIFLLFLNAGNIARFFFPIPYRSIIFNEAIKAGTDPYLIAAVVKTESSFNPKAVSRKGALGLMQIMPETGKWVAQEANLTGYSPENLLNPEYNVMIGVWYISDLLREYDNDTVLALAAYNAGHGNVNKWLKQHKWDGNKDSLDQIPFPETRQFVRKVLFYQQLYSYLYLLPEDKSKQ